MRKTEYIQSPLNYMGGKYRLLPQIIPLFPKQINTFVDLFCGGANVGVNITCKNLILNDINKYVVLLLETFRNLGKENILNSVLQIIDEYGLSNVSKNSYEYYGCNSNKGLGIFNNSPYLKLRKDFNTQTTNDNNYYIKLYVLIIYAFNNQIRFNSKGEFNLPVGKRDFNAVMQNKLIRFIDKLRSTDCKFLHDDFRQFDYDHLSEYDFIYADPPYLITNATYNENGGWNSRSELDLLQTLDNLNKRHIRFALSNVLTSKGKHNTILCDWLNANSQYKCNHLNYNYSNSNYQTKDRTSGSDEILITNY